MKYVIELFPAGSCFIQASGRIARACIISVFLGSAVWPSLARSDWTVVEGETKAIVTSVPGAAAGFQCYEGLPLLSVRMQGNPTGIRPYADNEPVEFSKDIKQRGGWAYILSGYGLKQLFEGLDLALEGIFLMSEETYSLLSLKGFSNAYKSAGLSCNPADR